MRRNYGHKNHFLFIKNDTLKVSYYFEVVNEQFSKEVSEGRWQIEDSSAKKSTSTFVDIYKLLIRSTIHVPLMTYVWPTTKPRKWLHPGNLKFELDTEEEDQFL